MMDHTIVRLLSYFEVICCLITGTFLVRSRSVRKFAFLTAFLATRVISAGIFLPILYLSERHVLAAKSAYVYYFYVYWLSYALEAILSLMVVYSIFRLAMVPLKGLQTLGMLVFRWVAAISLAVAIGMALGPHVSGKNFVVIMVTQLQQTSSMLTLCLLLFVCFAIRPMGLSYRSRIFGISVGLGLMASTDLAGSAWVSHSSNMYSVVNVIDGVVICLTLMTWSAYFAFPEPKRRIIVLPTTSPFLRWNQISIALGDEPGFVAIGGVPPEVFAPAEIEMMRRASAKMTSDEAAASPMSGGSALHSLTA
jgi:hypothetical protein